LLTYVLYTLFILACMVLIIVILLQPGKSGAGDLFSSSVSSTAFGPRGTASILSKITIGAAAAFMLVALMLSLPAVTGTHSVLQSAAPEATATPTPQPSPVTSPVTAAPVVPVAPAPGAPAANASPSASK
jgi:preprotein translocase subunit SecG